MSRKFEDSPLLTDQMQTDICTALSRTWYVESACDLAGLPKQTFYIWLNKGRKVPQSIYGRFRDAIKKALAEQQANQIDIIKAAAGKEWQAAAWLLERRFPDLWGRDRGKINELEAIVKEIQREREADAARHGDSAAHAATGNGKRR